MVRFKLGQSWRSEPPHTKHRCFEKSDFNRGNDWFPVAVPSFLSAKSSTPRFLAVYTEGLAPKEPEFDAA